MSSSAASGRTRIVNVRIRPPDLVFAPDGYPAPPYCCVAPPRARLDGLSPDGEDSIRRIDFISDLIYSRADERRCPAPHVAAWRDQVAAVLTRGKGRGRHLTPPTPDGGPDRVAALPTD